MDEYLERLFAESFKREVEQEETVIRSLPFIAAAAAIIVAVMREVSSDLPALAWDPLAIILHALLVLSGGAFAWTGWFVFQALRRRPFRYPRGETEIRETARRLIDYHRQAGLAAEVAELMALADLRREMVDQYAVCAENNRQQNEARQAARTSAFHGLMAAFLFAVSLAAITYIGEALTGAHADGVTGTSEIQSGSEHGIVDQHEGAGSQSEGSLGQASGSIDTGDEATPGSPSDGDQGIVGSGADTGDDR